MFSYGLWFDLVMFLIALLGTVLRFSIGFLVIWFGVFWQIFEVVF